jgi:hypothetical protein
MPKAKRFDITVLLMSGRSLTLSVKKRQTLSWVAEWVDTTWGLRCIAYDVIHNDKVLAWEERTTLQELGIYGPTTLTVVTWGPGPPRMYPRT